MNLATRKTTIYWKYYINRILSMSSTSKKKKKKKKRKEKKKKKKNKKKKIFLGILRRKNI